MNYTREYRTWTGITDYLRLRRPAMAEAYQQELDIMRPYLEGIPGITVSLLIHPNGVHLWGFVIGGNAFQGVLLRSVCRQVLATPGIDEVIRAAVYSISLHELFTEKGLM